MPTFFLALIAAALATVAGREAVRVARLSSGLGAGLPLLLTVWIASLITCVLAAWLGGELAARIDPTGWAMLVASVLALGAVQLAVLRPGRVPTEPTRSAGAVLLVLTVAQVADSTRLVVLALAVATGAPWLAAAGGALGSGLALTGAALAGKGWEAHAPLGWARWTMAGLLLAAAPAIGLGMIG